MFTGLIEETGIVQRIDKTSQAFYLTIECSKVLDCLKIGDSISVNGACETVVELSSKNFKVFASVETLKITTFNELKTGQKVNLERTLRLCDRVDGHLVSGHVDGTALIKNIEKQGDTTIFSIETQPEIAKQIVKKGSVAIDGISLTVSEIDGDIFKTAIIPHTYNNTTLRDRQTGDRVNIETDILAKYVEKYLLSNDNINNNAITTKTSTINMQTLERNGFL